MRIRTLNFLPEIFQTPTNRQFLAATLDQLVNPPVTQKIQGYIGSRFGRGVNANDYYVPEPTKTRTDYQLDPGVVFTKYNESVAKDFISYPGIIDALKEQGGVTENNSRLFNSEFYSWDSFTSLDKLINFNEYYWIPTGLPAVVVGNDTVFSQEDYTVLDQTNTYGISPTDQPATTYNPPLTLLRGGTYTFAVDQSTQFWIQGEPGTSGYSAINPNQYVRNILGVTNNGATTGTVTFTVPYKDAQNEYLFPGNNTVTLATNLTFAQVNGVQLSTLGDIDGVTALENLTLMFYNGTTQTDFYTITYTGAPTNPTIALVAASGIPVNEKITVTVGNTYGGLTFYRDSLGNIAEVPYLSSTLNTLYYQDGTTSTKVGVIRLIESNYNDELDVDTDIIGQPTYTSLNGVQFTNGLKVTFQGDVFPTSYLNSEYYVEGVGTAIELIPVSDLDCPEDFTTSILQPFDSIPYDTSNYDASLYVPTEKDYITIARNAINRNAWSRSNRWFHIAVINATATYNNAPAIATTYATQENKANRPIIEFYPNLKMFNSGTEGKGFVDFLDTRATDAFNQVNGQITYFPDVQVYTGYSATMTGVTAGTSTTITVLKSAVTGTFTVNQYINDSDNILPFDAIITAISETTTTLTLTVEWAAAITFATTYNLSFIADDISNANYQVFDGATIIFANDTSVNNKIYVINFSTFTALGQPVITLTEIPNGEVLIADQVVITRGYNAAGKTYYYDGSYVEAQQKITVNQPPLFDVLDSNGVSFGDQTVYPSSSFNGSKLFAYGIGAGVDDIVLGFPLRYSSVNNIGDISFDVSLNKDTFTYVSNSTPFTLAVNTGYVYNYSTRVAYTRELGWKTAIGESVQYQIFEFEYDALVPALSYTCDVAALDSTESPWPTVFVYVNNEIVNKDSYTVTKTATSTTITYSLDSPVDTVVQVLLLSDQVSKTAYYGIPINLNNNPFNSNITEANTGDIRGQYQSIFYNNPNSSGKVFGSNNYRDLGVVVPYGTSIIQNSASLVLPGVFLRKKNNYLFEALMFNSREYIKYKSLLVSTVDSIAFEQTFNPSAILDTAIAQIASVKSQEQPFFWSDMVPAKAPVIANSYTFNNFLEQAIFPLTRTYDFETANYYAVLVYVTRTSVITGITTTKLLLKNTEYTVSTTSPSLTVTYDLQLGDIVTIKEYTQSYGSYVPNTPTKLGLYPATIPEVVLDIDFITPTWFIKGHDGSYNKLYGDYDPLTGILVDFRDQALFEFECRIYNNLKLSNTIPIQEYEVLPGFFRTTDYTYDEFLRIYSPTFLNWIGENRIDYKTQLYNTNNEFTYNYSNTSSKIDPQVITIGGWRGIYEYFYDTSTPNLTPWEILGYTGKPTWWDARYGAAPYTSDNLVLWGDLEQGIDWNDGNPVILPQAIRSGLTSVIPVGQQGEILSPLRAVVGNYNPNIFQRDWKVGDVGPAEFSYRRSSSYPFDLMRILALTKTAKFFNLGADLDNYKYNVEFGQYLVNDRSHLVLSDIQIYGSGTAKTSYINWIVDYEKQSGVDATQSITDTLDNLDVRLVYRVAGYSDKAMLQFYVEKSSANDVDSSLLIPDESYSVLLYDNQPYDRIVYSPVIVQSTSSGFAVFGNSQDTAYFRTATPKYNGNYSNITVDTLTVKITDDYDLTEVIVPYGTTFFSLQEVAQFLMSYGKLLESKGMLFTDIENAIEINWNTMIQEFLYWAQLGWEVGSVITLNPSAISLVIDKEDQIVQPLTILDSNFVLNQNLYPIKSSDLSVIRDETYFSVKPLNKLDTVAYGQFNMSNFEHGIVFDNTTVFDDVIYNLITGLRQNRIFVRGTKSAEWNGTITASGFIYNQDNIVEWDRQFKYTKGSIVKYKNRYWTALTIVQPSNIFNEREWRVTDYNEIQKGLLPNSSTRSYESALYYNINQANLENDADLLSFSLIGYRPRDYLAIADLTDITQINVYKNMIKSKGTKNAVDTFKGATLPQGGIKYDVYENWAIKSSEFGGVLNNNFIEFKLNQNVLTGNPQIVGLTNGVSTNGVQQEVPIYSLFNYNRPIASPDVLPILTSVPTPLYPDAGYVNFNDVKMSSFFYSQATSAVNINNIVVPIQNFYVRDYYWVANYRGQWEVLTPAAIGQVISVVSNLNGTSTVTFSQDHELTRYQSFAIVNFDASVNGYYTADTIINTRQVLITLQVNTNNRSITGYGIGYRFNSQRVATPADIINLPLLNAEFVKNTVWVDENIDGDWAVYRKSLNYQQQAQFNNPGSSAFGSAVAYDSSIGYVVTDPNVGELYRYAYNPLYAQYLLEQTISAGVSYGTAVVHKANILVVSEPTGNRRVHIYVQNDTTLTQDLTVYQTSISAPVSAIEWGSNLALSGDTNWLYISDSAGQKVYAYRRQNFAVSSGYFVVGETYTITSVGTTDFTLIGAIQNKAGITFIATGTGSIDDTGTAIQVTYKYSTVIDGTLSGQLFGDALATDYYGDTVLASAPEYDYAVTASNSGIAYAYTRTVQNIEVQSTSEVYNPTTQIYKTQKFNLAWTPTPTTTVTASATVGSTGVVNCSIDMSVFNVNDTIIFTAVSDPNTDFGDSGISPYVTYYIASIGTNFIQLKRNRSSSTTVVLQNSVVNLNVYVQADPVYVMVNGTVVDQNQFAVIGNVLNYTGNLNAGDIVNVSGNQFTLLQTLVSPNTPRTGVQFGKGLDVNTSASEILVGAPFELSGDNQEGAVYRWTNAGGKFGIVTGTSEVEVTATRNLLINGYLVVLDPSAYGGTMNASQVAEQINLQNITNIVASATNNILTIQVVNTSIAQINEKVLLSVVDSATVSELGLEIYSQTQTILCPHVYGTTQFGRTIKFNEYDSFVVGAPTGTRFTATTFDFTDDENLDNDTVFDNNATQFVDSYPSAGAVYMYDYLGTYNESLTNLGNFVYAQTVNDSDQVYGTRPMYGYALDFSDWTVIAGAPDYRIDTTTGCQVNLGDAGQVTTFYNSVGQKDWSVYRSSSLVVDINRIQNIQIYSAETNNTLENLDYIDPLQGKILGAVRQNINVVSNIDPAGYNTGTNVNGKLVWGADHVGSIWFDTTSIRFVNYHQNDVTYNSRYWGAIFPGSDVAIYSWIASTVPPASYQGPGTPYDITSYTVQAGINSANTVVPTYYFWVRNTGIVFTKAGKTLADTIIASYISNPRNSGIAYMAPLLPNVFALYNTQQYVNAKDSVLHIGYETGNNNDVVHNEYTLIRENYADDFLPGVPDLLTTDHLTAIHGTATYSSAPPKGLYDRFLDSLSGVDETGAVVPNPLLPKAVQSGVLARPRQSFFFNRLVGLKNYLQYANEVLSQFPISELRPGASFLFAQNPITYNRVLNASDMVAGVQYEIVSIGTTNYIQVGAGSNTVGEVFTATGPATGSGTVNVIVGYAPYSAGSFVVGTRYSIETVGTTDFTSIGASSNTVGVMFTATGAGSGTGTANQVLFDVGEEYDASNYWDYVTWWADGYNDNTKPAIQVPIYASLSTLNVPNGTIVAVVSNGDGKTEFYRYESDANTWTRIGLQAGTIQFKSSLWDYATAKYGWGENYYDTTPYDLYPSEETRYIVRALNEQIYTDELLLFRNKSLILMFEYIQSETIESQNLLPWLNKTSLVDVTHTIRELLPYEVFQSDNQVFLSGYLNEVKPYHVLIKEFLFKYTGIETFEGNITDFDLPAQFDNSVNQFITPQLVYASPVGDNQFLPDSIIWSNKEYTQWYQNYGLSFTGVNDYAVSRLVSYMDLATNSIAVENVWGFPINGTITIGTEQIVYNDVDRDLGILYNLQRAVNDTQISDHLPGETIYMNLPAVILLDSGRGYLNPPRVTAYIDTSIYPVPTVEAVLQPVMYLDQVLSINVINPGQGYAVQPEIIIDAAQSVVFTSTDVDTRSNTIRLFAESLQTGDLVRYELGTGTAIGGLVDGQWYYVAILETLPVLVIALYNNYSNAVNDHDRVEIYSQGTGNHTMNLGARAVAVMQSTPIRENITTLRFDRTTYTSQVTDWSANTLYAAPFIGDYYTSQTLSASAIKMYSQLPEITSVEASGHGCVVQITDVQNQEETYWSTFVRYLDRTYLTVDGNNFVIRLYVPGGSLTNASGSTVGFTVGMPIKFETVIDLDTLANIQPNTVYYVAQVINETDFTITDANGNIVQVFEYNFVNTDVEIFTAQVVDTAILTVNYPGIRTATAISSSSAIEKSFGTIVIPITEVGTGGTGGLYTNVPIYFIGNVFGGLIENQIYYVTSVIDTENFTVSETQDPVTIEVYDTTAVTNVVTIEDSSQLAVSTPIVFANGTAFGGLQLQQVYYVTQILNISEIKISETVNGTDLVLSTDSGTLDLISQANTVQLTAATGSMSVNIGLPVSPGQVSGQEFTLYQTSNNYPNITSYTIDNVITANATATLATVNRVILDDITNMYVNMPLQVDTAVGGLVPATLYYVVDLDQVSVAVTDTQATGNLIVCDSTDSLYVNMPITFDGTGISNIVSTNQYYVESISGSTQFAISETVGGPQVLLSDASGDMTGFGLYYITVSLTAPGGTTETLVNQITDFGITQYPSVQPEFSISWILGGYRAILVNPGEGFAVDNIITISGALVGGTTPTNDVTMYVDTIGTMGEIEKVILTGTIPSVSTDYYLKAISATQLAVYSDPLMTLPVSGNGFSYVGFTSTNVTQVNTANVVVSDSSLFSVNDSVVFTGTMNGDLVDGETYFITSVDLVLQTIELSELPGGAIFTINGTGNVSGITMSKAGSYAFLPEPFYFDQSIVKYNNKVYGCVVSNGDPDFVYGKWELLKSSDRRLNALDRIVGYYQPTDNMPGLDLSQLVANIVYPNSTYYGNQFDPAAQWPLDTVLIDEPFYPTNVNLVSVTHDGNVYLAPANLPDYTAIAKDDAGTQWDLYKLADVPLAITDILYAGNKYLMTSTNSPTAIFKSVNGIAWSTVGYYTANAALPWIADATGMQKLSSAGLSLDTAAYASNVWIAAGDGVIVSSDDTYIWRETYTGNATLQYEFFGATGLDTGPTTGFVAVGSGLVANATGNLVATGIAAYSADGVTWTDSTLITDKALYGAAASNTIIVAVGEDGAIFNSINGVNWVGVRETQAISTNAVEEVLVVHSTDNFTANIAVRINNSFNGLVSGTTYYVANVVNTTQLILSPDAADTIATAIVGSAVYQITSIGSTDFTLIGAASNTVGVIFTASSSGLGTGTARRVANLSASSGAPDRTFLYRMPVIDTLRDVYWNGSRFMAVGDNGEIRTSTNGSVWTTRTSGTTEDLTGITFANSIWTAVGKNNTVLQSTDAAGITWTSSSSFVVTPPAYDVRGDAFTSGYGPEELVPGIITDSLAMIVTTRPGTTWEATQYAHVGYNVVSVEVQATAATQNEFSFKDAVSIPAQLSCFIISSSTGISTTIYVDIDFTVDWVNEKIIFASANPLNYVDPSSPGDTLRIDVYEAGNGNQLEKSNSSHDPIRVNTTTGFNEIYLNCNYAAAIWQGSGVIQPNSYPIEVEAYATDSVTNEIFLASVAAITENTPITFTGGVFGSIQEDVIYYVKAISQVTNTITVSLYYNSLTGLAGATASLTTATGSMTCVIAYGNGTVYTDPAVYHNGNKLVLGKTNSVTRTKASNNAITCNSTGGLIVNTPIVFSDTMIGGVTPQTTYYIRSIIDTNEFTISATSGGSIVTLTNAVGSASFVTSDYAFGLSPNGITAKMIFAAQYDTTVDYISYTVFGETLPVQYGFTLPQTQVFTYTASSTFSLDNYVPNDWLDAGVVELNGVRLLSSSYTMNPVTNSIGISAALTPGDIIAVTLFNDTQRQYFNTVFGLTGSTGAVAGLVVGSTTHDEISYDEITTAGAFTIGQEYVIQSIGTTDFTLIGAASNTVGLTFIATGIGAGDGTAAIGYSSGFYDWLTLSTGTTASIAINDALTFTSPTLGGIVAGQTYYVVNIIDSASFQISEIIGGNPFEVFDDTGAMSFDITPIRVNNIIAISNTISAPLTTYATNTTTGTNRVTLSTTSGMNVNDTIIFKGTAFGGIQTDGTVYFIDTIVSGTQITIKDENNVVIPLSTASGSMLAVVGGQPAIRVTTGIAHNFSENDLIIIDGTLGSIQLNNNEYYAKIIDSTTFDLYEQPYDPALFAPNYPVTSCSTYISGGFTWLAGLFVLRTTYATVTSSVNNGITVVDASKLIVGTPVYFTEPGVALGTSILGGLIAGQKYYIKAFTGLSEITVSDTWNGDVVAVTTDSGSVYVTQWEQDNVDRLWVTINGYRVPSSKLRLRPANEIGILTTIGTGDVVIVTSMMPSATPNEQVYINYVNQTNEGTVYRANANTRTWLTQPLYHLDTVIHVGDVTRLTNFVYQTSTTPVAVDDVYTVGINANRTEIQSITILNTSQTVYPDALVIGNNYKITTVGSTDFTLVGASSNEVGVVFTATGAGTGTGATNPYISNTNFTQGIVNVAPVVFITSGTWITTGDILEITTTVGKDILLNGELITIYAVDTINNTITSFVRGADGTGIQPLIPMYTEVFSIISDNRMSNELYSQTWNSYVFNPEAGDPLQISETAGAVFLNVDIT